MKILASTPRTIQAIRKADALPTILTGGAMRKGNIPGGVDGSQMAWARITAVTDAQNYTASIWTDRNETNPVETLKAVYVSDIVDTLAVNDWIPVQASNRTDIDYENIQQLGLL